MYYKILAYRALCNSPVSVVFTNTIGLIYTLVCAVNKGKSYGKRAIFAIVLDKREFCSTSPSSSRPFLMLDEADEVGAAVDLRPRFANGTSRRAGCDQD